MLITTKVCGASSCSNELAKVGILCKGPPRVTLIIVMGAESKGGFHSKIFLVQDPAPSKEKINETSKVGGTLAESPTPQSVDEEVAMTSMLTTIGGVMVVGATLGNLLG